MAVRTRSVLGRLRVLLNNNTGENYDDDQNIIVGTFVFISLLCVAECGCYKKSVLVSRRCQMMIVTMIFVTMNMIVASSGRPNRVLTPLFNRSSSYFFCADS